MKLLLLSIYFLALNINALEIKQGEYELISGDKKFCEDGPIVITSSDLKIGTRYIFPNFKDKKYQFKSDDLKCNYSISNFHNQKLYKQDLSQECQEKSESFKRITVFEYTASNELLITFQQNTNVYKCKLRFIK